MTAVTGICRVGDDGPAPDDGLDIPECLRRSPVNSKKTTNGRAYLAPSHEDLKVLGRWYEERFNGSRKGGCEGDRAGADASLRWRLAEFGVPPEHIEHECERVMQVVFGQEDK